MKNFTDIQTVLWLNGPAAVNVNTGVLYINEKEFQKLGENSRRFVIMHELGHLNADRKGEQAADEWALEHLLGLGESSIDMLKAFYEAIPFSDYEQRDRAENLLRKVFETEFNQGNEKAKPVIDIFNSIMPGDEDIKHFSKNGSLLKISGSIATLVGSALTATGIAAPIGAAVAGAGALQTAAGKNLAAKSDDAKANAEAIEQQLSLLEQAAETEDLVNELNSKKQESDNLKKQQSKKILIVAVVAVVVVVIVSYFLKK
ncbi:MAG: ImmA/IrrE family metallo-endopeptidase [Bacteroidales bacterium]|nr:ImmA/IrrE family metallo-endopeptidase [Bacteroidales bacterium]